MSAASVRTISDKQRIVPKKGGTFAVRVLRDASQKEDTGRSSIRIVVDEPLTRRKSRTSSTPARGRRATTDTGSPSAATRRQAPAETVRGESESDARASGVTPPPPAAQGAAETPLPPASTGSVRPKRSRDGACGLPRPGTVVAVIHGPTALESTVAAIAQAWNWALRTLDNNGLSDAVPQVRYHAGMDPYRSTLHLRVGDRQLGETVPVGTFTDDDAWTRAAWQLAVRLVADVMQHHGRTTWTAPSHIVGKTLASVR